MRSTPKPLPNNHANRYAGPIFAFYLRLVFTAIFPGLAARLLYGAGYTRKNPRSYSVGVAPFPAPFGIVSFLFVLSVHRRS